jgi:hypothetical protein
MATPVWADPANGDAIANMGYNHWSGYRDWASYNSWQEFNDYPWTNVDAYAYKFTPETDITFDHIRTQWQGSGGPGTPGGNVYVWVEQCTSVPNYHPSGEATFTNEPGLRDNTWLVPSSDPTDQSNALSGVATETRDNLKMSGIYDFNVGSTSLTGGQTYAVIVYCDNPDSGLRLASSSPGLNKTWEPANHNWLQRTYWRQSDGAALSGAAFNVNEGDDGIGAMPYMHQGYNPTPVNPPFDLWTTIERWSEGDPWNDSFHEYAKTKIPQMELLDGATTVLAQGSNGRTEVALTADPYGQEFVATAAMAAEPYIDRIAVYLRKNVQYGETEGVTISLTAEDGTVLGSQTVAASDISWSYGKAVDDHSRGIPWGWVVANISPVTLTQGNVYRVVASSLGDYDLLQQDFGGAGASYGDMMSTAGSYGGTASFAWNNGVDVPDSDVLFMVVPEPATMSLLALGALAVVRRRRR